MKSHETRHGRARPSARTCEDIKPVIQAGGSDTAALDNVFEVLVRAGRDAPMAKTMLIPASIGQDATMPQAHRDMFLYCNCGDGAVGRPGGDRRHRRPLGDRRHGPQRAAPAALHASPQTAC